MRIIPDLWRYSKLAGKQPSTEDTSPGGGKIVAIKRDNDYGFVAIEEKRIVFAFCGSNDVKDWIENLEAAPAPVSGIHSGFWVTWLEFQGRVFEMVKNYGQAKPIFVTGHSRGGALAALAARGIAHNSGRPCSCITFGAPRVGAKEFREEIDLLPINLTRVVNGFDVVTMLPPAAIGFRHCGKLFQLKQPWFHALFFKVKDHLEESYDKAIKKRFPGN